MAVACNRVRRDQMLMQKYIHHCHWEYACLRFQFAPSLNTLPPYTFIHISIPHLLTTPLQAFSIQNPPNPPLRHQSRNPNRRSNRHRSIPDSQPERHPNQQRHAQPNHEQQAEHRSAAEQI